jgi:hypothetical protein
MAVRAEELQRRLKEKSAKGERNAFSTDKEERERRAHKGDKAKREQRQTKETENKTKAVNCDANECNQMSNVAAD